MKRISFIFAALALGIATACGGGGSATPDAAPDAFQSKCGKPGDMGNELGVGKFCPTVNDCGDTQDAPICSSLGDPTTHFCTKTCQSTGSAGQCGTNATCECNSGGQCGCTPNSCLM